MIEMYQQQKQPSETEQFLALINRLITENALLHKEKAEMRRILEHVWFDAGNSLDDGMITDYTYDLVAGFLAKGDKQ